jgi:hypothetical protein
MFFKKSRIFLVRLASLALICTGFAQFSVAGVIGTEYLVEADARATAIERIEAYLVRDDVAQQLESLGVDKSDVDARLQGLTNAELLMLEGRLESMTVGGDALALIGAVFLVLLILELVGVTDIFKSI